MPLKVATSPERSSALSSVSTATPFDSTRSCSASSKSSPGTSSTILPNICTKRRYESCAKRSFCVWRAKPCTEWSLRPRLRTVSIIPGIENGAPERTETSSGSASSPRRLPIFPSSASRAGATSSIRPSGSRSPPAMYALHASVVMVKPGGTGRPRLVISARLAPFPPSRYFCSLLPSSKAWTYGMLTSRGVGPARPLSPSLLRWFGAIAREDDSGVPEVRTVHEPDARVDQHPRDPEQQRDHQPQGSRQADDEHDRHDVSECRAAPCQQLSRVGVHRHDVGEPLPERLA